MKLITSLRNPIDRAYSGYLMHIRAGKASANTSGAFDLDKQWVRLGFYRTRLLEYYNLFPKEQIKVVLQEDLQDDTRTTMREIYNYLQVDLSFGPYVAIRHNKGKVPKSELLQNILIQKQKIKKVVGQSHQALQRSSFGYWTGKNRELGVMSKLHREQLGGVYRYDILESQDIIEWDLTHWLE